jgi:hypothetical protein
MISTVRPPKRKRQPRIERDVGQHRLHFRRIEVERLEKREPALEFELLVLDHAGDDVAVRDDGRASRLERRIAVIVIAMRVGVDHPLDRLIGDFADALDEIAAVRRMLTRVDDEHALGRHQEAGVRGQVVVEEIEVRRDLFQLGRDAFAHAEVVELVGGLRGACKFQKRRPAGRTRTTIPRLSGAATRALRCYSVCLRRQRAKPHPGGAAERLGGAMLENNKPLVNQITKLI